MEGRRTQLRGSSREGHATERTSASSQTPRRAATGRSGGKAGLITTIAVIGAILGAAGPAAADDLVSNLGVTDYPLEDYPLNTHALAQSFTTGSNVTGYQMTSVSLDFQDVTNPLNDAHDPVYVYVQNDDGNGRPNLLQGNQVASLTKNGVNYLGPVLGVNEYKVWKTRCQTLPPFEERCLGQAHLNANTRYWVYIWAGRVSTLAKLYGAVGPGTGTTGWTLGNTVLAAPNGTASWSTSPGVPVKVKIEGTANPAVNVSISDVTVTEGTHATADFVVSLSRATSGPVSMNYGVSSEDETPPAAKGTDYGDTNGTLRFEPGETEKTIPVPIFDDAIAETEEKFNLWLSNIEGATFTDRKGVGRIQNAVPLTISIADATAQEGTDETIDFTVSLSRATNRAFGFQARWNAGTADADDFIFAGSQSVVFEPGDTEQTVSYPIRDDGENEPNETFTVSIDSPNPAFRFTFDRDTATGTITNTETLEASFENMPASHDGSKFSFNLAFTADVGISIQHMRDWAFKMLNGSITRAQRVDGRSDYWKITVNPGGLEHSGVDDVTITVKGNRNCKAVGAICTKEQHPAQLTNSPSATVVYSTEPSTPTLSITGGSGTEGTDSSITFTVTLDEAATDTVTVDYATSDGTADAGDDYTSTSGTLTFDAGETSKTVSVSIADDTENESDETLTVTLSNASGADLGTKTATGTIRNRTVVVETTPSVSIAGGSGTEGDEGEIDFTVTLDEAASGNVSVDYATSDGSADAGDDYTAKSGTLSFSAGETSKTISVSIEDDIENESDETFTVTLSNPSGADLGTSSATGTIRNRYVAPLTARFENMPSEHDGSEFTFELHFSENPEVSFRTLKNHAFTVDEGDVTRAQRKNPQSADKNKAWTITVKPDGNDTISLTLPETTSCSSNRAICTGDGRKLSHSTSATVAGPPSISVADATVTEAAGAVLAFTVSLSRSSGSNVTVDYTTSDGTATAGADYTATSGTLTISAGSTSATVDVTVLDDSHDDGGETLTLTLSNAANGTLGDSTATGTIENSDPLPKALMARFGRTAAVHIVEQVEERVNAPRQPGFDGRLAGRQVNGNMGRDFALDFLQQLGGGAGYTPMGTRQPMHGPSGATTGAAAMGHAGGAPVNGGGLTPMGASGMQPMQPAHGPDGMGMSLGHGSLLTGSRFALNRVTKTGGILSFWSRSAQSSFQGREGVLALNGDVRTTMFGADYSKGRMVTGVSLSHSRGLGSYAGVDNGRVTSAVTGLYPWIGYKASERVTVWTVAGYGAGGLLLNPGAGTPVETGLSMAMAAGGGRGQILGGGEGFGLAFKADALWVGTRTDESNGPNGRLKGTSAAVNRLRTALEGSQSMEVGGRIALTPSVEVGIRQDGGDAERGTGMDVGAGLVFADAVTGLSVDFRIRTLVVHQAEGYAERGVSISVSYNPTPSTPLGFSARVSPAWGGDSMSGAEALWGRETMGGMGRNHLVGGGGNRLNTEVGYGLPVGARFVGTPRVGVATSEYGRDYRVGYGMQVLEQGRLNLELGIDAERRESPVFHLQEGSAGTDQRVLGRATVQW